MIRNLVDYFICLLLLAIFYAYPAPSRAQFNGCSAGFCNPAKVGITYTGPGDIVSGATAWYGLRAYNAAYATSLGNAAIFRRSSDNTNCTAPVTATGGLNLTGTYCSGGTTLSAFCGTSGGSCFATQAYDQSGNTNNVAQATAASQPQLSISCFNSLPCLLFAGSQSLTKSVAASFVVQPFTESYVANNTHGSAGFGDVLGSNGGGGVQSGFSGTTSALVYAGSIVQPAMTSNTVHAVQNVYNGASSIFNLDGTGSTISPGSNHIGTDITVGSSNNPMTGQVFETGLWPSGFTTGNNTSMCHNQFSYYGTATSC